MSFLLAALALAPHQGVSRFTVKARIFDVKPGQNLDFTGETTRIRTVATVVGDRKTLDDQIKQFSKKSYLKLKSSPSVEAYAGAPATFSDTANVQGRLSQSERLTFTPNLVSDSYRLGIDWREGAGNALPIASGEIRFKADQEVLVLVDTGGARRLLVVAIDR